MPLTHSLQIKMHYNVLAGIFWLIDSLPRVLGYDAV
jgi:hypothetical protein